MICEQLSLSFNELTKNEKKNRFGKDLANRLFLGKFAAVILNNLFLL